MEIDKRISPYEYVPGIAMVKDVEEGTKQITTETLRRQFRDGVYGRCEYALMESLYRYPYLNRKNMELFTDERLKDRKYNGYENMIKQLWKEGCLNRYSYDTTKLYALTEPAREYMKEKLDPGNLHQIKWSEPGNAAEMLECAALAQWHLSLMRGGNVKKNHFMEDVVVKKKSLFIPSYLEIDGLKYHYKVLSFAVPKTKDSLESFLDNVFMASEALRGGSGLLKSFQKEIFLLVLVCSDTEEMELMTKILNGLTQTAELQFYFVQENNTLFSKGLDLLYESRQEEGSTVLETISVKQ